MYIVDFVKLKKKLRNLKSKKIKLEVFLVHQSSQKRGQLSC